MTPKQPTKDDKTTPKSLPAVDNTMTTKEDPIDTKDSLTLEGIKYEIARIINGGKIPKKVTTQSAILQRKVWNIMDLIRPLVATATAGTIRLGDISAWKEYGRKNGYLDYVLKEAVAEAKREMLEQIRRMNLWSKGNVEGTRRDIIAQLEALSTKEDK